MQQKLQRWFRWCLAVVLLLAAPGASARAAVTGGYLPWTGPPPLRYAALLTRSASPLLPPLQLTNPTGPPPETRETKAGAPKSGAAPQLPDADAYQMPDFLALPPEPAPDAPSPGPSLNYQPTLPLNPANLVLLLRAVGTNANSGTLVLPAFIPPAPFTPPSSSATYHSAPAPP